jgi:hypothetical protein
MQDSILDFCDPVVNLVGVGKTTACDLTHDGVAK